MSFGQAIIAYIIDPLLFLLWILVIANVVMSWLISFNVVNLHNQFVAMIWRISTTVTEPFLRPLRSVLPPLGGMDFSPLILLLLVSFVRGWVVPQLYALV